MECNNCNEVVSSKDLYCSKCGASVEIDFKRIKLIVFGAILFLIAISSFGSITKFSSVFQVPNANYQSEYIIKQSGFKYFETLVKVINNNDTEYPDLAVLTFDDDGITVIGIEIREFHLWDVNHIFYSNGQVYQENIVAFLILVIQCILILGLMLIPMIFIIKILYVFIKKKEFNKINFGRYFVILFSIASLLVFLTLKIGAHKTYIGNGLFIYILFCVLGLFSVWFITLKEKTRNLHDNKDLLNEQRYKLIFNGVNIICSLVIILTLLGAFLSIRPKDEEYNEVHNFLYLSSIGNISLNDITLLLTDEVDYNGDVINDVYSYVRYESDYSSQKEIVVKNTPWESLLLTDLCIKYDIDKILLKSTLVIGLITLVISLFTLLINVNSLDKNSLLRNKKMSIIRALCVIILFFCAIIITCLYNRGKNFPVFFTCSVGIGIIICMCISILVIFFNYFYSRKYLKSTLLNLE